jgi:hypothetical protein
MAAKRIEEPGMNTLPTYDLELRAADERRRLHSSVSELKDRVRERMDVERNVREHVVASSAAAAVVSMILGYAVAGIFTKY